MVAVVSGTGLGLFNSSTSTLGEAGTDGNSNVGRGRDQVYVNTTTGNLVVQSVDDTLNALGLDFAAVRTYNSQGLTDEDNNDQWRLGVHQRVSLMTGTVNTAGSVATKTFGDGSSVAYTWNTTRSRYESGDGDGANDFLTWNSTNSTWTWTDGSSRATEEYGLVGGVQRMKFSRDADGNTVSYTYTGSLLTSLSMAGGTAQTVFFDYTGSNLGAIRVVSNGVTQTLTRYGYDGSNRLTSVTVDLTPSDNSVTDNVTYTTTYTYDSTSKRIASITQKDGSSVAFTYLNVDGDYRLKTVTDAEGRVTTFNYSSVTTSGGTPATGTANQANLSQTETLPYNVVNGTLVTTDTQTVNTPYNLNNGQLTTPTGSGTWSPTLIDYLGGSGSGATKYMKVAFDSNGNGFAIWSRESFIDSSVALVVSRYTKSTNTWSTPTSLWSGTDISGSGIFVDASLAVDSSGNALVAYNATGGSIKAARFDVAAGTWTTTTVATATSAPPTAAINGAFAAVSWTVAGAQLDLFASRWTGSAWSAAQSVESSSVTISGSSVAVDNQGNISVLFNQGSSINRNRYNASTSTWSGSQTIATGTGSGINVAMDGSGNGFAVWAQGTDLMMSRYTRSNDTWAAATAIDTASTTVYSPRLAIDSAGNAVAAWIQDNGGGNSVYAKRYVASTSSWGAAGLVETSSQLVSSSNLSASVSGNYAAVSWQQYDGAVWNIWAATNNGTAWSTAATIDQDTLSLENTVSPSIAIDSLGNATAFWESDGSGDQYYARFTPGAGGGAAYYTMPAGATWQSVANTLYGVNSAAAGTALQNAMPAGTSLAQGNQVSGWPATLQVPSTVPVPPYYLVPGTPATPTWQSIAAVVYGINSAAAGSALQTQMQSAYPALSVGLHISNLPTQLQVPTTVPWYFVVQSTDWATTCQSIYGSQDPGLIQALKNWTGLTTLTVGQHLTVPLSLPYTVGGTGSGPSIYQQTDVIDSLGLTTTYLKDSSGRLISVQTPAVGGARIETRYTYDAATGNVATITLDPTGLNRITTFAYDAVTGLLLNSRDSLGNTVVRTYNANNQLDSETSYLVRDPDGSGAGLPSSPLVTRYVYDTENHLRFSVSADGRVTEHVYDTPGQRTTSYTYAANTYSGTYTESALNTWATGQRANALQRVDYTYDFRGNVSTLTAWAATDSSGVGTGAASTTRFVYDQRGNLLSKVEARGEATATPTNDYVTNYTYDGLSRMLTTSAWVSSTETARAIQTVTYDDANRRTVSTFANGLTQTSIFNKDGDLTSVAMGPAALGTSTNTYDAGGRLRVVTDQTGIKTYSFYDDAGRLIGTVDGDGSLTEFIYNRADQLIKKVRYSTRLGATTLTNLSGGTWSTVAFSTLRTEANATPATNQITRNIYDASGVMVYSIDQIGAVTQFIYDGAGRLTDQVRYFNTQSIPATTDEVLPAGITVATNAADRRSRFFYNGDGQLAGTLDGAGYLTENTYDAAGRLTASIGYYTVTNSANWLTGTLATLRPALDAARDITTRYFYDGQGRKVGQLDGENYLTENVYDVAGNITQSNRYDRVLTFTPGTSTFATLKTAATGATTHTTSFTYDGLGKVLTQTNFENTQTLYTYDIAGNLISTTRANGVSGEARTTAKRFDALGRVTQELTAEGSAALAALGGTPTQAQIDDVWSKYGVLYTYDNASRRTSATVRPNDSQTNTTYYYYDNDGRLRFELDPRGQVTENRYDALGQLVDRIVYYRTVSITSPTGGLLTSALITSLSATESANVHEKTTYGYSLRGEVTSTLTAAGATTSMGYTVFGELATRNAGSGFTAYDYTYDTRGLQKLTKRGATTFEDRTYDAFGRLGTVIDARGNTFTTTFDRLGRQITSAEPGDTNSRVTTYDAFSRVLTVRDKLLNTTTYAYDDSTRTVTVTTPESIAVSTVHNRHGDTLSVTANGNTTNYTYDLNGRLTGASDGLGALEGRSYDRAGRQVTATNALGVITTLAYDASNRLITRTVDSASGGLQLVTTYSYDTQNRILNVTEPGNRLTRTEYDRDGRVFAVTEDPSGTTPRRTEYAYDTANNVTLKTEGMGSALPRRTQYVFDALGRRSDEYVDPTSLGGTLNLRTQYKFDNNGNLTRKIDAKGNSTWYVYDAQNRLSQTIDALGGVTQLSYDAEDRVVTTRRFYNTVATGSLGDTPSAQTVTTTLSDHVSRSVYDRDGREKYTVVTSSASGSPGAVTETGVVTERTFDSGGNVTRSRVYRTAITVPSTVDTGTVSTALTNAGNSLSTLDAGDHVEWTAYDLRGQAVFTVDGTGAVVKTVFDVSGNVIATIEYATSVALTNLMTTASLTTWSNQSSVANYARNRNTFYWLDALNRTRFTLDGEGYLVETRYLDSTNQQQTVVYAGKPTIANGATLAQVVTAAAAAPNQTNNQTTTQSFDAGGRVVQVTDALGKSEYLVYDAVGNKIKYVNKKATSATDAAYTWTYDYDANHRVVYERSPSVSVATVDPTTLAVTEASQSLVTHNFYDALGNLTSRVEAEGTSQARTTTFEYDLLGRQTATVSPTVGVYDPTTGDTDLGNGTAVARREISTQIRSETSYDIFGNAYRNRLVTAADASVATNGAFTYKAYDNLGRVVYEVDAKNQCTTNAYDVFGNKITVTRLAAPLSSSLPTTGVILLTDVSSRLVTNASNDRAITTSYDRLNRAIQIKQPSVDNFITNVGSAGGTSITAQPTTEYTYNAFGEVVKSRELIGSNIWANSYNYYDNRGLKTAELDPAQYLTRYFYDDETGDLTSKIEYARPTTGTPDVDTYGTIVTSANGNAAGDDRQTNYAYDKLNHKVSETIVNLEYSRIDSSGNLATAFTGAQTTTYGYDALGNQTRVTVVNPADGSNINTYTFYDVLGRAIAIAQPTRNPGLGAAVTPYSRLLRNANGDLVQQIEYYDSLATAPVEGTLPNAPAGNATLNRITTMQVDAQGHAIRTRDATSADRFASYNIRGDVAKEWQVVVNPYISSATTDDITETKVTVYRYDSVGQQTQVMETQRYNGSSTQSVTRIADYNAFGEIIAKYNQGATLADKQYFDYDQAGRVWRSNAEDGVDKVYQYDLRGHATVELRSQTVDLAAGRTDTALGTYTSAASVLSGVSPSNLMRTETAYDIKGNLIEKRLPTFDTSTGLAPVGANLQLSTVNGQAYVNWSGTLSDIVNEVFEYRVLGSTGSYSSVTVEQLSAGLLGANVHSLYNQSYEYRIRYMRGVDTVPFAESTGTFRVDRATATSYSISRSVPDTSNDVSTLAIQQSAPIQLSASLGASTGWNGFGWQNQNVINVNIASLGGPLQVVINYTNGSQGGVRHPNASMTFTFPNGAGVDELRWNEQPDGNGVWPTYGGVWNEPITVNAYTKDANGFYTVLVGSTSPPVGPPMLIWSQPPDSSITATFKYKKSTDSTFSSVQAEKFGPQFRVAVQNLLVENATYNYEVEYWRAGVLVAKKTGNLNSSGVVTTRAPNGTSTEDALNAWLQNVGTPSIGTGYVMQWATPPSTWGAVTATFGIRQSGTSGSFVPRTITTGAPYSVYLGDLPQNVAQEYQIVYTLGGRVIAEQRGTVTLNFSASATTTLVNSTSLDLAPTTISPVQTVTGWNGLAGITSQNRDLSESWMTDPSQPNGGRWIGTNQVSFTIPNIDPAVAPYLKVTIRYASQKNTGGTGSNKFYTTGAFANTGAGTSGLTISWTATTAGLDPLAVNGGIATITGIDVVACTSTGTALGTIRTTGGTGTAGRTSLVWAAPLESGLTTHFFVNGVERTVTQTGGNLYGDVTGINGTGLTYTIQYWRSGDPQAVVEASGTFSSNTVTTTITSSQTATNRNAAWIPVSANGNRVQWSRVADQGNTIIFEYFDPSVSQWVRPTVDPAGDNIAFSVSVQNLATGTYQYRLSYANGTGVLPYVRSTGTFNVTTTTTPNTTVLNLSAPTFNQQYGPARITPVTLPANSDVVSWSYAKQNASDTITFKYTVNGTEYSAAVNGSGPSYSAQMSALPIAANQAVTWVIEYRSGGTYPYAMANGHATITVTGTQTNPVVTLSSQTPAYPSGVAEVAAPTDLGGDYFGWSSLSTNAGDTVTVKIDGAVVSAETIGTGRRINLSALTAGTTHTYELLITASGASNPYARAAGTLVSSKGPGAITGMPFTIAAPRPENSLDITPYFGNAELVTPPDAVYFLNPNGQQGPHLEYGPRAYADGGGYAYTIPPNVEHPVGEWIRWDPPSFQYIPAGQAITFAKTTGSETQAVLTYWPQSSPSAVTTVFAGGSYASDWRFDLTALTINGTYGYRIEMRRTGSSQAYAWQDGTFTRTASGVGTITPTTGTTPTVVTAAPKQLQSFDRWGNLLSSTDTAGNVTNNRYNGLGLLVQTLDPTDHIYKYNNLGAASDTTGRAEKTNFYDSLGRLIETQDGYDNANRITYNAAGQQISQRGADFVRYGASQTTINNVYDIFGNLLQATDQLGYRTRYKYDKAGRVTQIWREIATNNFSSATDVTSVAVTDSNLVQTQYFVYDQAGRRVSETDGVDTELTRYRYDFQGNVIERITNQQAANGVSTKYTYDANGKEASETDAIGSVKSWVYDAFGRVKTHTEYTNSNSNIATPNGTTITYLYNEAGALKTQTSVAGQNIQYNFDAAGNVTSVNDGGTGMNRVTLDRYDTAGRQSRETVFVDGRQQQDTRIAYDAHNRIKNLDDPDYREQIFYDANGNRSYLQVSYIDHQNRVVNETFGYTYDEKDRVLTSTHYFSPTGTNIDSSYTYNGRGDRLSQTTEDDSYWEQQTKNGTTTYVVRDNANFWPVTETYTYDGLARLKTVTRDMDSVILNSSGVEQSRTKGSQLVHTYTYDKANRVVTDVNANIEGGALVNRNVSTAYDLDGRASTTTTMRGTNVESVTRFGRSTLSGTTWLRGYDDAGNLRSYDVEFHNSSNGSTLYTTTYKSTYKLGDSYLETRQDSTSTGTGAPGAAYNTRSYNVNGELVQFSDSGDATRTRYFANNQSGQALTVITGNFTTPSALSYAWDAAIQRGNFGGTGPNYSKAQYYFFAQGNLIGTFGQLQKGGTYAANFDVNSTPISDNFPSAVPATVVAQAGDTLRIIAGRVFGDGNLWYVIANENGLTNPDADLPDGMQLRIPNDVISLSNKSDSFKPFNAADALGDTTPTQPAPPAPKGCGVIGMIIMIVVMVVLTIFTAGVAAGLMGTMAGSLSGIMAAGATALTATGAASLGFVAGAIVGAVASAATQGVGMLLGIQDKFDWKQVAAGALSGGIGGGLARAGMIVKGGATIGSRMWAASANAVVSNSLTQGASIAVGLQKKFDWRSLAQSAVAAPLAAEAGKFAGDSFGGVPDQPGAYNFAKFASDSTSTIVTAGVRSAMGGRFDVKQVTADVFGNAIGNAIVDMAIGLDARKLAEKAGWSNDQKNSPYSAAILRRFAFRGDIPFEDRVAYLRNQEFARGISVLDRSAAGIGFELAGDRGISEVIRSEHPENSEVEERQVVEGRSTGPSGKTVLQSVFEGGSQVAIAFADMEEKYGAWAQLTYEAGKVVFGGGPVKKIVLGIAKVGLEGVKNKILDEVNSASTAFVTKYARENNLQASLEIAGVHLDLGPEQFGQAGGQVGSAVVDAVFDAGLKEFTAHGKQIDEIAHQRMGIAEDVKRPAGTIKPQAPKPVATPITPKPPASLPIGPKETAGLASKSGVVVGQQGTYGELKRLSKPKDGLQIDHNPSLASNVKTWEDEYGRALTDEEYAALRDSSPAMATPDKWHQQESDTYGGRNNPEKIANDSANATAAMDRSMDVYRQKLESQGYSSAQIDATLEHMKQLQETASPVPK